MIDKKCCADGKVRGVIVLGGGGEEGLEEMEIDELVAMREHRRRKKKRCSLEL